VNRTHAMFETLNLFTRTQYHLVVTSEGHTNMAYRDINENM